MSNHEPNLYAKRFGPNRLQGLDAARTCAMLLVFLFHFTGACAPLYPGSSTSVLSTLGPYGTNLLLVISGFFTYQSLVKQRSTSRFLWRRFLRLQIPLLPVLCGYLIIFTIFPETSKLPADLWGKVWMVISNATLMAGLTNDSAITVSWTVSYIFAFTVLYAIGYRVLKQYNLPRYAILAGYIIAASALTYTHYGRVRFLIAGAAFAHFDVRYRGAFVRTVQIAAFTVLLSSMFTPVSLSLQIFLLVCSVFLLFLRPPAILNDLLSKPVLTFIGSRSYSFYLTHSLVLHVCREVLMRLPGPFHQPLPAIAISLAAATVVAWKFDKHIDRPVAKNPTALVTIERWSAPERVTTARAA